MNIILKAFDDRVGKQIVGTGLKGIQIGTCISILNDLTQWPDLIAKDHVWMSAKLLRAGRYPDVDWTKITPLDEALIESMQHCETTFFAMVERYARYKDIPYKERCRQYHAHLRYWNHVLETKHIDLLLMNTAPHQCYDLVIYDLCKRKHIPILYIERLVYWGTFTLERDWEHAGEDIRDHYRELQSEYADPKSDIPLNPSFERYFRMYAEVDRGPWYMGPRDKHLEHKSFLRKWGAIAFWIAVRKPDYFLRSILSVGSWKRKWQQHNTATFYDHYAQLPDLTVPYIYVPLHMQPEATTCPLGGVFHNQELIVQMLAEHIPPGTRIYVKEHPAQGEICRSIEFYQALREIPSVTLIPRHYNTFTLIHHAIAVAAATGTAMLEGLFRQKPALMFGHQYFQYAPGVFRIRTREDCKRAVETVCSKQALLSLRDMRLFVRSIQDCSWTYAGAPPDPHNLMTLYEKAVCMGEAISRRLHHDFTPSPPSHVTP